jgi:hypothetical protein
MSLCQLTKYNYEIMIDPAINFSRHNSMYG